MQKTKIFLAILTSFSNLLTIEHLVFNENFINILGYSKTIEQLDSNINLLRSSTNMNLKNKIDANALKIIFSYLQNKFSDEFNSEAFYGNDADKKEFYQRYLEPLIFIAKYLKLTSLLNILNLAGINTNIDKIRSNVNYNLFNIIDNIHRCNDKVIKENLEKKLIFLLKIGANFKDNYGNTPLMHAVLLGSYEIVKLLIQYGANINDKNKDGNSILMLSIKIGHEDIASKLIELGANIHEKNNFGESPIMFAYLDCKKNIFDMLIENGANINDQNNEGDTTLILAIRENTDAIDYVRLISSLNIDVNITNNLGRSALSCATYKKNKHLINLLLKNGANINHAGFTPLMAAIDDIDLVRFFIGLKADVNARDNNGNTPIILAAQFGNLEIINLLIDSGADTYATNNKGQDALAIAKSCDCKNIIEFLEKRNSSCIIS